MANRDVFAVTQPVSGHVVRRLSHAAAETDAIGVAAAAHQGAGYGKKGLAL